MLDGRGELSLGSNHLLLWNSDLVPSQNQRRLTLVNLHLTLACVPKDILGSHRTIGAVAEDLLWTQGVYRQRVLRSV